MIEARRVGAALRWLRLGRKLSQQQVAAQIGVSQPMYSRIEAGTAEPGITLAPALAEALGVSLGELLIAFGFKLDVPELTISALLEREQRSFVAPSSTSQERSQPRDEQNQRLGWDSNQRRRGVSSESPNGDDALRSRFVRKLARLAGAPRSDALLVGASSY